MVKKVAIVILGFLILLGFSVLSRQNTTKPEERILMVNNKLYYGTSEIGPMGDSGSVGGKIISSVEKDTIPTENGQSNFGSVGNPFTKDEGNGAIMVLIEDQWFWFYK